MAYENSIGAIDWSWVTGADLSAKQFYAVQLTTSQTITLADATVRTLGVLQDTPPSSGATGTVRVQGISRAVSDGNAGAIACMDALASDANGKLVKTTTDNDEIVAIALEPSTADGTIIAVLLQPLRRY